MKVVGVLCVFCAAQLDDSANSASQGNTKLADVLKKFLETYIRDAWGEM
jgi:hypothetical protein